MDNCSNHKKDLFGVTDMKLAAEAIGDLHYANLCELLYQLNAKLHNDGAKDATKGRVQLAQELFEAADLIMKARGRISRAYKISQPFMDKENQPPC